MRWTDENEPTTESLKKRGRKVNESGTVEGKSAAVIAVWAVTLTVVGFGVGAFFLLSYLLT